MARPSGAVGETCSDGLDNDGDQKIDYPADPGCASPADQSEGPTCPPLTSGTVVCLEPGSLFERYEVSGANASPSGPDHRVAGWVDQYRFNIADVIITLSCVRLAVDANGANPCAQAGGTYVTRVATLVDRTESEPELQTPILATVEVCSAELTATAAGNGIDSAPAYALC